MNIEAIKALKSEAAELKAAGELTLGVFESILGKARIHCRDYPNAMTSFLRLAPDEWIAAIKSPPTAV